MESDCAIEIVRASGLTAVVTSSLPCVLRLRSETASVEIPWMPGISPSHLRLRLEEGTAHQAELSRVPLGTTFPSNGFWWAAVAFESLDLPTSEPVVADGVTTYDAGTVHVTGVDSSGGSWLGPGVPGILPLQLEPWRVGISGPTLLCHGSTHGEIALASNSLYSGVVTWYSEPAGIEGTGNPLIIDPGDIPPGLYEVFVYAQKNPWVWGVTHVVISHLDLSETTIYANASDTNLTTIGLSGNTYPQTGITVTSDPPGISNQTFRACDLEPGVYTVTVGNGSCETREVTVIALSVEFIEASSTVAYNSPQQFEGHQPDFGDPCDPDDPGQALVVFHKSVRDENFVVQDFDVNLHAAVLPATISHTDLSESWSQTSGPASGALDGVDTFDVKYQNPTNGGLYQFEFDLGLGGYENSGANLLLPLGGPDVTDYLLSEAERYEDWLTTMKTRVQSVSDSDWVKATIILGHTKRTVAAMLHREGTYEAGDSPCKQFCPGTITIEQYVFRKDFLGNFLFGFLSSKIKITLGSAKLAAWVVGEGGDDPDDYAAIDAGYQYGWTSSTDLKQTLEDKGIESMQVEAAKRGWPSTNVATGSEYSTWGATPGANPD